MEIIDLAQIKRLNNDKGMFWFSPATTRFFHSRYPRTAQRAGNKAYFVTSEQLNHSSPRGYSVRVCDMSTGYIDTVGDLFCAYSTSKEAYKAIAKLLKAETGA